MSLELTKVFKGIQQVKALPANPEKGVIYFVREHVGGNPTGNASVYFGDRLYGNVEATRLAEIESSIDGLGGRVDAIEHTLGKWTEEFTGNLQTVASVVKGHATTLGNHSERLETIETNFAENIGDAFDKNNSVSDNIDRLDYLIGDGFANDGSDITAEILKIKESLEPEGDTARAIAAAQSAADKAQGEVDALEIVVGTKAAQSDLTAHTGNADIHVTTDDKAKWDKVTEKAAQSDLDALAGRVSTAEGEIDALEGRMGTAESKITAIETSLASGEIHSAIAAAQSAANKAQGEVDALEEVVATKAAQSDLTAHTGNADIHVTKDEKDRWTAAAKDVEDFFNDALEDGAEQVKDTLREIQDYINSDATAAATMAENITKAQNAADKAQGEVDALEEVVATKAAQSDLDALAGRVSTAEGEIDALQTSLASGEIHTAIVAAQNAADKAQGEVDALEEVVGTKADGEKVATGIFAEIARVEGIADTAVQTVSVAEGCEMLSATKEGTTVTLALYYGGDDAE